MRLIQLLAVGSLLSAAVADSFSLSGCYKKSSVQVSFVESYSYQSSGYCEGSCAGDRIAATYNGTQCYCGSTAPDSSDKVDSSNCNVACSGWPYESCGGDGYYSVYINADVSDSSSSSSSASSSKSKSSSSSSSSSASSSKSSSTTSSSTSKSSSTSASSDSSSTSASSSSSESSTTSSSGSTDSTNTSPVTIVSTVTAASGSPSVIYKTVTPTAEATASTTANSNNSNTNNKGSSSKKLSTGGIVGAVIGSLAGLILILLALFFLYRRYKKNEDDFDDEFTLSGPLSEKPVHPETPSSMNPNPFLIAGGYNNFDTQQQQLHHSPQDSFNRNSSLGNEPHTYSQLAYAGAAAGAGASASRSASDSNGHSRSTSNGYGTSGGVIHSGGNGLQAGHGSFSEKDFIFQDSQFLGGDNRPPTPELGRRKLSNGSLPDMIARQPGSLKVVNN